MRQAIIASTLLVACAAPAATPNPDAGSQTDAGLQCTALDVERDPDNCGECGHSCLGAACRQSRCDMQVIAQGEVFPAALATDGRYVYWVDRSAGSTGTVRRLDKTQLGLAPVTLASNQNDATDLAVSPTALYWVASTDGMVMTMPLAGGTASVVAIHQAQPSYLALSVDFLVWVNHGDQQTQGSVMKQSLSGGPAIRIASDFGIGRIAANATTAVYSTQYDIWAVPLAGGAPQQFASGSVNDLAMDDSYVYWTTADGVFRKAITVGRVELLYAGYAAALAVDDAHIYFVAVQTTSNTSDIRRVSLAGGNDLLLAVGQTATVALALDDQFVYWVNQSDGKIVRVPK